MKLLWNLERLALFAILFFQGLSFLHCEMILLSAKLCYIFEEKLFPQHNFMKKDIRSCLKMNLCVYIRKVGVPDEGRTGVLWVRVRGIVWNTIKGGEIEKRRWRQKFKKEGQAGLRGGCLKKGGLKTHYELRVTLCKLNIMDNL